MSRRFFLFAIATCGLLFAPAAADASANDWPVLFVHGWCGSGSGWDFVAAKLHALAPERYSGHLIRLYFDGGVVRRKDTHVVSRPPYFVDERQNKLFAIDFYDRKPLGPGSFDTDAVDEISIVEKSVELQHVIDEVRRMTGQDRVILVAFSMGGLVSRAYIQNIGWGREYSGEVARLVTIDTPHWGTPLASWGIGGLGCRLGESVNRGEMEVDSLFLNRLRWAPLPRTLDVVSIASWGWAREFSKADGDAIVPYASQHLGAFAPYAGYPNVVLSDNEIGLGVCCRLNLQAHTSVSSLDKTVGLVNGHILQAGRLAPHLESVNPAEVRASSSLQRIVVDGVNFEDDVRLELSDGTGTRTPQRFRRYSDTALDFESEFPTGGTVTVRAINPRGGTSNELPITVLGSVSVGGITPQPVVANQTTWLTVRGSGFQSALRVTVNGFDIAATGVEFHNPNEIRVSVHMGGSPPYTATLVVRNPDGGSAQGTFQVAVPPGNTPPSPSLAITSVTPGEVFGGRTTAITVRGTGFDRAIRASLATQGWGIDSLAFVSPEELRLVVTMPNGTYAANLELRNPSGVTARTTFQVREVPASTPVSILSISPQTVNANETTWLTLQGRGFQRNPGITVNGFAIATAGIDFRSAEEIRVSVRMGGNPPYSATLIVRNPDGGTAQSGFNVVAPAGGGAPTQPPTIPSTISISNVTPSEVTGGRTATLTVRGSSFDPGVRASLVPQGRGIDSTTYVSPGELRLTVTMPNGNYTASLELRNPNGATARTSFQVREAPAVAPLRVFSVNPSVVPLNQATWITVRGTGFQQGLTVRVAGFDIAGVGIEFRSSEEIRVSVRMGGSPPYIAPVVVRNPDGATAEGYFEVRR